MAFEALLREGRINGMTLRNRIITGPMERGLANRDGSITPRYIDYLVERARGGASLLMVESTYVDARGLGHLHQLGCHGDHVIPGLTRLAEAVHAEGGRLGLELYFGGRQTPAIASQHQPLAPSAIPCAVLDPRPTPRAMTTLEIADMVQSFADAARRAVEAGIDMIHLHGAHGYLLGSFLSPFSNHRTDEYGGSAEARSRFPLEVLAAVRSVTGESYPIGYRLSATEYVDGGLTIEDTSAFASRLVDAGIDLIDVSGGIYESSTKIIQGPEVPRGGFVDDAARIKSVVGDAVPVSVTQRLNDPALAEAVMLKHGIDFISMSRAFHADPHYVRKIREQRPADILPCMACHQCTNLLEANVPAGCAANPDSTYEARRRAAPPVRGRAVVVGGGPAGLHAARLLARQGASVTLYEQADVLGGQIRYSSRLASDYGQLITYLERQVRSAGVDVRVGSEATLADLMAVGADEIIIATGAGPGVDSWPPAPTIPRFDVFSAMDRPIDRWTGAVAILGAAAVDCGVGLYLARLGVEVHLFDAAARFAADRLSPGRDILLNLLGSQPTAHLHPESTVEVIEDGRIGHQLHGSIAWVEDVEALIVGGRVARTDLGDALSAAAGRARVHVIGDASRPRDVYAATHEAAEVVDLIGRTQGRSTLS